MSQTLVDLSRDEKHYGQVHLRTAGIMRMHMMMKYRDCTLQKHLVTDNIIILMIDMVGTSL